jgi:hypothetical protein
MLLPAIQRLGTFLAVLFACVRLFAADLTPVPKLTDPVMDTAQMLQPEEREELNGHLLQYSREKGSQIAVLTVPAISPETPFDYSARVMEEWKLGRKDVSDGVLLLLVRDERKTHLAVGRGLEGAIPDVYAKRILQDVLRPYLREGKTGEGVAAAVAQIEKLIAGEKLPEVSPPSVVADEGDDRMGKLLISLVALFCIGELLKMCFGPAIGSLLTGSSSFGAALVLGLGIPIGIFSGLIMTLLALFGFSGMFKIAEIFISSGGGGGWHSGGGGGWHGGGGGGGFSGGGGSGFSGGGGSFGGGGASGGW